MRVESLATIHKVSSFEIANYIIWICVLITIYTSPYTTFPALKMVTDIRHGYLMGLLYKDYIHNSPAVVSFN